MQLEQMQKTSLGFYLPPPTEPDWDVPINKNFEAINAQLENRVQGKWVMYNGLADLNITRSSATIDLIVEAMQDNSNFSSWVNLDAGDADIYPWTHGTLFITKKLNTSRVTIEFYNTWGSEKWIGEFYGTFKGWHKVAFADTSLQWYMPVPQNGYTLASSLEMKYAKDSCNNVFINGLLCKSTPIVSGEAIFTLPVGFRPSKILSTIITTNCGVGGVVFSTYVHIHTNGTIKINGTTLPASFNTSSFIALDTVFKAVA